MAQPVSEYERSRLEKIAKNKELFRDLQLNAAAVGIAPKRPPNPKLAGARRVTRKTDTTKAKETVEPSRKSLRLQNIEPDNIAAKRKAEVELNRRIEEERALKRRRGGD